MSITAGKDYSNGEKVSITVGKDIAIIGMGLSAGEFTSLENFTKGLMTSKKVSVKQNRAEEGFSREEKREKLLLSVAEEAFHDADVSGSVTHNTAVILSSSRKSGDRLSRMGGEASVLAARFGFRGPVHTIYDREITLVRTLALAQHFLDEGITETVMLAAVSPLIGSEALGAAAVILKSKEKALEDGDKIYACISAVVLVEEKTDRQAGQGEADSDVKGTPNVKAGSDAETDERIIRGFKESFEAAEINSEEIRVLEIPDNHSGEYNERITEVCGEQFGTYLDKEDFMVKDIESWLVSEFGISAMASLIKHALQLFFFHVFIFNPDPVIGPSWFEQKDPALWNIKNEKRASVLVFYTKEGTFGFVTMTECIDNIQGERKYRTASTLLPVRFQSSGELRAKLETMGLTAKTGDLRRLYDSAREEYRNNRGKYTIVIMFESRETLLLEIKEILDKIEEFSKEGYVYESRRGTYFTSKPFGKEAKIVYMNPPGSMQHLLLFYEMLLIYPGYRNIYARFKNGNLLSDMDKLDYRFGRFGMELCMISIVDQIAGTHMGLKPDMLIGASLGEIASFISYDIIDHDSDDYDMGDEKTLNLMMAFKDVYVYSPERMQVMYLKGSLEEIIRLTDEEEDVYILVYASPNGAFISGKTEAVDRILQKGHFFPAPMSSSLTIHTPLVDHFYEPIYQAAMDCKRKLKSNLGFEVYSTYYKKAVENTYESLAEFAAAILTKQCDFTGLLDMMYEKGARVYIDMSTAGSCLTWAEETFYDRDSLCFSIYPLANEPVKSILRTAAKLISNDINFDGEMLLDSFNYYSLDEADSKEVSPPKFEGADRNVSRPSEERDSKGVSSPREGTGRVESISANETSVKAGNVSADEMTGGVSDPRQVLLPTGTEYRGYIDQDRGVMTYINRGFQNNMHAYGLYLENEAMILARSIGAAESNHPVGFAATPPQEGNLMSLLGDFNAPTDVMAEGNHLAGFADIPMQQRNYPAGHVMAEANHPVGFADVPVQEDHFNGSDSRVIWDYDQLLEVNGGMPSKVWGERYKPLDNLVKRARLPLPPFMFVGRITGLDAEFGQFRPSRIDMEYDISDDCVMIMSKNTISYVLLTEASHVAILLLAYIGIDMIYEGEVSYRILNTEETFHSDFPILGETIQATLEFVNFQKSGSTTLVTSRFSCFNNGELVMTMELTGGFFSAQDLNSSKGIISKRPPVIMPKQIDSIIRQKESPITDMDGFFDGVYGPFIYPKRTSAMTERLYIHPHIRMMDRVVSMEFQGGEYGLGRIIAEKDIDENHWSFDVHFKNDPVFPGSLLAEAANQIQLLFSLNAGFFDEGAYHLSNKRELHIKSVFRGQVKREKSVIRFEQNFKEASRGADGSVTVVSDCDVFWQGIHVVRTEDISLVISRIGQ